MCRPYILLLSTGSTHVLLLTYKIDEYEHERVKLREKRWKNKEILLKINM